MMKRMSTPALFMTINPADICDPLLGAIGGIDPVDWAKMSATAMNFFVARNPAAAAMFFDEVIQAFVRVILRYDPAAYNKAQAHR
jgi:hypothetical protein